MSQEHKGKWYLLSDSKNYLTWVALIAINFIASMGSAIENSWFNTFVYSEVTPDPQAVALMVSVSAITAALAAIFGGAASDRHHGRLGKRKPFIIIGFLVAGFFCLLFPFGANIQNVMVAIIYIVVLDALMMTGFGAAFDGVLGGYITDITNVDNRGRVQSILQIVGTVGSLAISIIAGILIDTVGYKFFFFIIGGALLINGVIGGLMLPDTPNPKPAPKEKQIPLIKEVMGNFKLKSIIENKQLFLLLLAVMIWGCGWYSTQPYILTFAIQYLGFTATQIGVMQVVPMVISMLIGIPIGIISDKWGRKKTSIILIFVMSAGAFIFSTVKAGVSLVSMGLLLTAYTAPLMGWYINYKSWARDLFPKEKRGQFAGITLLFVVTLPMVIGSQIGSAAVSIFGIPTIIDGNAGFIPTPPIFAIAGAIVLLAVIPLLFIKQNKPVEESAEGVAEQ